MSIPTIPTFAVMTILALSPHLDDAAFSIGPLLAQFAKDARVVVATVFSKSVAHPQGFALACQLDKGLSPEIDYMALRRKEDILCAKALSVEVQHGPFAEAPHRGYQSAAALFGDIIPSDDMEQSLTEWMEGLTNSLKPDLVLAPLAIGNHVDHQWVCKLALRSSPISAHLACFQDQPYSSKTSNTLTSAAVIRANLSEAQQMPFDKSALECALQAAEAYESQIPFQFGSPSAMNQTLRNAWDTEIPVFPTAASGRAFERLLRSTQK